MDDAWAKAEGSAWPLGASWVAEDEAYNFALYAKDATAVSLILYGGQEFATLLAALPFNLPQNRTGRIWHMRVPLATAAKATHYAYQVDGPNSPGSGARFDSQKILLDPYARGVFFPPSLSRLAACQPGSNAGKAPLSVLPPPSQEADVGGASGPRHDHDLVIYEMHVRGFTQRANSGVPDDKRGTFAGAVEKIPYLQQLGITAVELLPVHQFDPSEGNYWGYMTLNFFSPHYQYSASKDPEGALAEFRSMVEQFHNAGIEVFLDVVYNHTTEGGLGGPTYCYRGIDNSTYYALDPSDMNTYVNHSGCGNDLRTSHPAVRRLVVDSLRYWVRETNVDGFRFDLASIFAYSDDGSLNLDDPPVISEITSDPALANVRLIAEPWTGDGSAYEMGRAFPGRTWRQWNDHFRNTVRSFVKGDDNLVADLTTRIYGSTDLFPDDVASSCRRWQSVNYVDSHDGLNMCDLVSYTNDDSRSWNCGFEGTENAPPDVVLLRRQQVKNFCSLLILSNGTPMFCAGDEFMNTQDGNANPYNQDNETTWLDWSLVDENAETLRFFSMMIAFRKAHPSIGRDTRWGEDVAWVGPSSGPGSSRAIAFHLKGAAVEDADLFVMINAYWEAAQFSVLAPGDWRRIVDTSLATPADVVAESDAQPVASATYAVAPRSIVVLSSSPVALPQKQN
jgi:isoamylase